MTDCRLEKLRAAVSPTSTCQSLKICLLLAVWRWLGVFHDIMMISYVVLCLQFLCQKTFRNHSRGVALFKIHSSSVCIMALVLYFWNLGDLADLAILLLLNPKPSVASPSKLHASRCFFKASLHHNRTHVRVQIRAVKIMRTISGCHKG